MTTTHAWVPPADTAGTRVRLVRHGATVLTAERRFSGVGEQVLTELGRSQADAVAARLGPRGADALLCSPMRRARETAAPIASALGLDVVIDERFGETDFGEWEGFSFAEVGVQWPDELAAWLSDSAVPAPGGESFHAVQQRVSVAMSALLESYAGQRVVVVSHVTPIKLVLAAALDLPLERGALYRIHLDPGSLSEVACFADGNAVVRRVNDTGHLTG